MECLVQKLKGVVDGNNLPLFNAFHFPVGNADLSSNARYVVTAVTKDNKTARAYVDDVSKYFTRVGNPSSPYYIHLTDFLWPDAQTSQIASQDFYTLLGNFDFYIENKYNLKSLAVGGRMAFDIKQLDYCDLSEEIKVEYAIGNLDDIVQFPNSKDIEFNNPATSLGITNELVGSIAVFSNCTACEKLLIRLNPSLTGNIELLGKLTNLKELQVEGSTGISGTIERFVAAQVSNGRTSVAQADAINIHAAMTGVLRFGGNVYNPGTNAWLTWESANKIIVYGGGTSATDYTKVYAKGATAEEITAWEHAGKTVTVIS